MPPEKILREYKQVDAVQTWADEKGRVHYRARAYEDGKEYPDSKERGYGQGKLIFSSGSASGGPEAEENFFVSVRGASSDIEGQLACIEYKHEEEPNTIFLKCDLRSHLEGLERHLHYEEPIRRRLGERAVASVEKEVRDRVDRIPKTVFHKTSMGGFIEMMNRGFRPSDRLSTSFEHLEECELYLPKGKQQVSLHFRLPERVCPIKVNYTPENFPGLSKEESFSLRRDLEVLSAVVEERELKKKYPGCSCLDIDLVAGPGRSTREMETEKEILLTACKDVRIKPEDVIDIIVETQCGADVEKVREEMVKAGMEHLLEKLRW